MSLEAEMAALADRQHGVFARWHLPPGRGITAQIDYRVKRDRLVVLYPGVYAYGHRCLTPAGRRLAAALACGPCAVVSHRSAGGAWGVLTTDQRRTDVTVPGTSRRSRRDLRVHRARELWPDEVTILDGVPVTSLARTVCDVAGVLNTAGLRRVLESAQRQDLLDITAVLRVLERRPSRRGAARLRQLLDAYRPAPMTRSGFEADVIAAIATAEMPAPRVNSVVEGYEVDLYWPAWRLVVELDGRGYHSSPQAFEADPLRDARLMRAGLRVLRVTWRRFYGSPHAVLADIRALAALV